MRARVVVFPIKERNWCFSRSLDPAAALESSSAPQQLRDLFRNITSTRRSVPENAEIVVDFVSEKMNRAWVTLEKAPEATLKSKLHSLGLWLLSRVKPSEVFLKSVSKDVTEVEITYPARFYHCQTYHFSGSCSVHILIGRLSREVSDYYYLFQIAQGHGVRLPAMRRGMVPRMKVIMEPKLRPSLHG
ncbi:uncharacterized protein LOC110095330 isoform X4 [Dendrobium catenatum]|uniref:uncharacterized protein LOC110095330 isoform X4 n=1 Tax=Dendrobium catenatum TaxID=906689 RepID=UPI00109FAA86|nr:uncharacterized protein LOC110095330 isoform X4 [Dendrobium catenatum]